MTLEVDVEECVDVDVDADADGAVELGWQRWRWTLFVFSADQLAISKPCGDVKSLDSADSKCVRKRAAPRHHCHCDSYLPLLHTLLAQLLPHPPFAPPLSVTATSHQLYLQHGSEGSASKDSD